MVLIGYARVSTEDQTTDPQLDALRLAGCEVIFREQGSGGDRSRPELARAVERLNRGDVLVVARIDRLARSLSHLLEVIDGLDRKGAGFRSLGDPIDTTSPQGRFSLQILGAVAEFERALIRERTRSGLKAARERGRVGGNPGLRDGNPTTLSHVQAARDARRNADALRVADEILPRIRQMRPAYSWKSVARRLSMQGKRRPAGGERTGPTLMRVARRLVRDRFIQREVLNRATAKRESDDLVAIVAMATKTLDNPTLANIARHLEAVRCTTPRRELNWSISSIQHLLAQAVRQGLVADRPMPPPGAP